MTVSGITHRYSTPNYPSPSSISGRTSQHPKNRRHHLPHRDFEGVDKMTSFTIQDVESLYAPNQYSINSLKTEDRVIDAISSIKGEVTTRDRTISLYERHCPALYL